MQRNVKASPVVDLRHVLKQTGIELVAISETKLCEEFPDSQFHIEGYTSPALDQRSQRDQRTKKAFYPWDI